jgi:hypothetical protein
MLKKTSLILLAIFSVVGLVACSALGFGDNPIIIAPPSSNTTVQSSVDGGGVINTPQISNVQVSLPTSINSESDLYKLGKDVVYPGDIQIPNCLEGINYCLWGTDDDTPILGHKAGDGMAIRIYNGHNEPCIFRLEYVDIPEKHHYSITNLDYDVAPKEASAWLSLPIPEISVNAHELASVPLSFNIPVGKSTPEQWEFIITVTNVTYKNQVSGNMGIRFLVTMAK